MKTKKPPRLVVVTWLDAYAGDEENGTGAWGSATKSPAVAPCEISTVGWLVVETAKYLRLAQSLDLADPDEYVNPMSIPRGCVVKVRNLK